MPDRTDPLAAFLPSAALTDAIDGIDDDSCDFDEISEFSPDIAAWNPGDLPCLNHLALRLASLLDGAATCADETLAHTLRERAGELKRIAGTVRTRLAPNAEDRVSSRRALHEALAWRLTPEQPALGHLGERAEAWRQTTARLIDAVARPAATVIGFLAAALQRAGEGSPAR